MAIPFLLLAVEFNNIPPTHLTAVLPGPAAYQWLKDQPAGVLMEYPANAGSPASQEISIRQYSLYQMVHQHPMFLSVVTQQKADNEARNLEPYYSPGVVERLKNYGVAYVFVHRSEYLKDGFDVPQDVPGLRYVQTMGDIDIYTLT